MEEQLDATKGEEQPAFARCRKSLTKCTARRRERASERIVPPFLFAPPSHPTSQVPTDRPTASERGDRERAGEGRGLHKDAQSIFILGQTQFSFCALSRGPQTLRVPVSAWGGVDSVFGDLRIDSEDTILEDGESHENRVIHLEKWIRFVGTIFHESRLL